MSRCHCEHHHPARVDGVGLLRARPRGAEQARGAHRDAVTARPARDVLTRHTDNASWRTAMNRSLLAMSWLLSLSSACPGVEPPAADAGSLPTTTPDAGPCADPPAGYGLNNACAEPQHRHTAVACTPTPPADCSPHPEPEFNDCLEDADCSSNVCKNNPDGGCFCGAPDCTTDEDCGAGFACICGGIPGMYRNACLPAACRTDADCASGRCLLSLSTGSDLPCCDYGDFGGLFCATPADECEDDNNCDPGESCAWRSDLGHFACYEHICICD